MSEVWDKLKAAYAGKSVFLTGHTGFKGGWLATVLQLLGAKVTGYALAPDYENGIFDLLELKNLHQSHIADIRDLEKLSAATNAANPDFFFHLAAQPLVRYSYKEPIETYSSNVMGTLNVLEAIRQSDKAMSCVLITTDKVYKNNELGVPFKESDHLGGHDMYSSSKACCEILIESYVKSFLNMDNYSQHKKSISTCRAGNVIGGGDWASDRLVPDIVRALKEKQSIEIRSPKAIRPWQHVIEPVFVYLYLAMLQQEDPVKIADTYNIGPNESDALTVQELLELSIKEWGSGDYHINADPNAPHEAKLLLLDCDKLKTTIQWKPQLNVNDTIEMTIGWYKNNFEAKTNSKSYTISQIESYASKLNF